MRRLLLINWLLLLFPLTSYAITPAVPSVKINYFNIKTLIRDEYLASRICQLAPKGYDHPEARIMCLYQNAIDLVLSRRGYRFGYAGQVGNKRKWRKCKACRPSSDSQYDSLYIFISDEDLFLQNVCYAR